MSHANAARTSAQTTEDLQYGASFRVYTDSGAGHFKTPLDAFREFFDNSVQYACEGNDGSDRPSIRLVLSIDGEDTAKHFAAVCDNGCGMNREKLQHFLTYFKTQDDRGLAPAAAGDQIGISMSEHFLGKFGIGAKEAAFYLADGVDVITKVPGDELVRHVSISRKRFEERSRQGMSDADILTDKMTEYPLDKQREHPAFPPEGELLNRLTEHSPCIVEMANNLAYVHDHFTIMILPEFSHAAKLKHGEQHHVSVPRIERMAHELANTYAFQMFPGHYTRMWALDGRAQSSQGSPEQCNFDNQCNFDIEIWESRLPESGPRKGCLEISLNTVVEKGECYVGKVINNAIVPDYTHHMEGSFEQKHTLAQEGTTVEVKAVLTYFAYDGAQETKPIHAGDATVFVDVDADDEMRLDEQELASNPLLVYWNARLVPHDLVSDLPMVKGRDNTVHSADEYAHRCCGLVFFPRDMAITRNKMKLLHEHDSLSAALRGSDERQRPGNCLWRRSSAESVRQWLVKCHEHDKEVEFSAPLPIDPSAYKSVVQWIQAGPGKTKVRDSATFTGFQRAKTSGDKKSFAVKVKDTIKVNLGSKGTAYGVVKQIVVEGLRDNKYRGLGWFRFERYPKEIYGAKNGKDIGYLITRLGRANNGVVGKAEFEEAIARESVDLPRTVVLTHWGTAPTWEPGAIIESNTEPKQIQIGDEKAMKATLDFAVQVRNGQGSLITTMPKTGGPIRVWMHIRAEETDSTTDQGEEVLPMHEPTKMSNASPISKQYFFGAITSQPASWFIKNWTVAGIYTVTFGVDGLDLPQESLPVVKFEMIAAAPEKLIVHDSKHWVSKKIQLKLCKEVDQPLAFFLQDKYGNICPMPSCGVENMEVQISIEPEQKRAQKKYRFTLDRNVAMHDTDKQLIVLSECKAILDNTHELSVVETRECLGTGENKARKCKMLVHFSFPPGTYPNSDLHTRQEVGLDDPLIVTLFPGEPDCCKIEGVCMDSCVEVQNGTKMPQFRVQLVDAYGIDTFALKRVDDITVRLTGAEVRNDTVFSDTSGLECACDAKGGANFRNLIVEAKNASVLNTEIHVDIELECKSWNEIKTGSNLFSIKILPSNEAATLQVWCTVEGSERRIDQLSDDDASSYIELAGTRLEPVFVKMFNEAGMEVNLPKGVNFTCSWSNKKKHTSQTMPPLLLPTAAGTHELKVTAELPRRKGKGKQKTVVEQPFSVQIVSKSATQWQIKPQQQEIACGEKKKLIGLLEIYAADEYGNAAELTDQLTDLVPDIEVDGADLAGSKKGWLVRSQRSKSTDDHGVTPAFFEFRPTAYVVGKAGKFIMTVLEHRTQIAQKELHIGAASCSLVLIAGAPASIRLRSDIIADDPTESKVSVQYNANVTSDMYLTDLEAQIVDIGGNEVATSDMKLSVKDDGQGHVRLSPPHARRTKQGLAQFRDITLKAEPRTEIYTLYVEGPNIKPAWLDCHVRLGNHVFKLGYELADEHTHIAGEPLDLAMSLIAHTEDGEDFDVDASAFELSMKLTKSTKRRDIKVSQAYAALETVGVRAKTVKWLAKPREESDELFVPQQSGTYQVTGSYTEIRMTQAATRRRQVPDVTFEIQVQPGPAVELMLGNMNTINASNARDPNQRLLVKRPIVYAVDRFKNKVPLVNSVSVFLSPDTADDADDNTPAMQDSDPSLLRPTLEGVDEHGRITSDPPVDGKVRFQEDLLMEEGKGTIEGVFRLVFQLNVPPTSAMSVRPCEVRVAFVPDGQRAEQLQAIDDAIAKKQAEHSALQREYQEANVNHTRVGNEQEGQQAKVQKLAKELKETGSWGHDFAAKVPQAEDTDELQRDELIEDLARECAGKLKEFSGTSSRPAVVPIYPSKAVVEEMGSLIVNLATHPDEQVARILSWMAGGKLASDGKPTVLAMNTANQKRLYDMGFASMSEDSLSPYAIRCQNSRGESRTRTRNREEQLSGKLPPTGAARLPLSQEDLRLHTNKQFHMPRLAVNMIELKPEHEKLRDTLFYAIFGISLIVDTLDDALEYRRCCAKARRRCPAIFTMDGKKSDASGLLEPCRRMPRDLKCVFGAAAPKESREAVVLRQLQDALGELMDCNGQFQRAMNNLNTLTDRWETGGEQLQEEIRELHRQKGELKRSAKKAGARGGGGGGKRQKS